MPYTAVLLLVRFSFGPTFVKGKARRATDTCKTELLFCLGAFGHDMMNDARLSPISKYAKKVHMAVQVQVERVKRLRCISLSMLTYCIQNERKERQLQTIGCDIRDF